MKKPRLMVIEYSCHDKTIERLKTCLDMCCIKYVIFREYGFVDGTSKYKIYMDRNKHTWQQVMEEINRVKSVKFKYESGCYIKNGCLYQDM